MTEKKRTETVYAQAVRASDGADQGLVPLWDPEDQPPRFLRPEEVRKR